MSERIQGKVKWFKTQKGFGFISVQGQKDVFVHFTAIKSEGFKSLEKGMVVEFELEDNAKGPKAKNVIILQ